MKLLRNLFRRTKPEIIGIALSTRARVSADPSRIVVTRYVQLPNGTVQTQSLDHSGNWQNRPEAFEYEGREGFAAGINLPDGTYRARPPLDLADVGEPVVSFGGFRSEGVAR